MLLLSINCRVTKQPFSCQYYFSTEAFNQLRVRTALERTENDDASPSISGADHPPSPKKRKAAGSLQEDSSTQQRSGNDQQDISKPIPNGPEEELLQVFEQIQLNKDFYDAIARTESCAGEALPQKNTRTNAEIAAFQAAVKAAKAVLRDQVKDLAERGQEASPAFLQAYALNVMSVFAWQAAEASSYSGEDLGDDDDDNYFTSSSVERPNSSSLPDPASQQARHVEGSKKRQQENQSAGGDGNAGGGGGSSAQIDKEITVLERSASEMVIHSPTTRSNATPSTTHNNNRTPTASGILSSGNGNNSSLLDPELSDTAGMMADSSGLGGVDSEQQVQGTPPRRRGLLGGIREAEREADDVAIQVQQQRGDGGEGGGDGDGVLLHPQTPGEPPRPGNDATDDEEDHGNENEEEERRLGDEEEEQHAALVREMSILEAVDAEYDIAIETNNAINEIQDQDQQVEGGVVMVQEEEIEELESPQSRDENENRFFGAGGGADNGGGGMFGPPTNATVAGAGAVFPPGEQGGMMLHQEHPLSPPSAINLASPQQQQASLIIAVPQRPQAAAGHREKRDPRPSSSGGPSRLSNDPPKRQRKGPGFIVGSAPQDRGGGGGGELFTRVPPSVVLQQTGDATLPSASPQPLPAAPLGDSDGPAVSLGSVGGGGGNKKKTSSSGKLFRNDQDEIEENNKIAGKEYNTNNNSNNNSNPVLSETGRARGRKRDAPVVVREGASLSISLETVPAGELGGRGAWGSSLVCADLTVHEVASHYWPSFKKNVATAGGGGGGARGSNVDNVTAIEGGGSVIAGAGTANNGTVNEEVHPALSSAEKEKLQELTAALEAAILGAMEEEGPNLIGGRRMNAKVKSLAASAAFDELWKEREQGLMQEGGKKRHGEGVAVAPDNDE